MKYLSLNLKIKSLCLLALGAMSASLMAQGLPQFEPVLAAVEQNSPRIATLRAQKEAAQQSARQSNVLEDPEVEFAYFWGDPGSIGQRWDLGVSQSFDFPTTYLHRRKAVRQACNNAEWQFRAERQDVLLQAQQLAIELVYYNASIALAEQQKQMAETLATGASVRLDAGDITILDYQKMVTNRQLRQNEYDELLTQREAVMLELTALNGDHLLALTDTAYEAVSNWPQVDFMTWWQEAASQSAVLKAIEGEALQAKQELQVAKSGWFPKWSVGYFSENPKGEAYRGLKVGVSLPVWNNRHKVRQAQAESVAAEADAADRKMTFMARLKGLYAQALSQQQNVASLERLLQEQNTAELLTRAYEAGSLSLYEYLYELSAYYDLRRQWIAGQRAVRLSLSELSAVSNFSASSRSSL